MTRILATCGSVWLLLASPTLGQTPTTQEPATKLESLLLKRGAVIVKEFKPVLSKEENSRRMVIDAATLTAPTDAPPSVRKGFRIEITEHTHLDHSETAFLDQDEVDSMLHAMTYMLDLSEKWKPSTKPYTEVVFSTVGGFSVGFFQDGAQQMAVFTTGRLVKVQFFTGMANFAFMKQQLDEAAAALR